MNVLLLIRSSLCCPSVWKKPFWHEKGIYYIDESVLVENRPLVKFIRNYIRDSSGVFSISSGYRWRHFPLLLCCLCKNALVYIIKRKLHGGLKIWILFSRGLAALFRKILFLPLENKIHIFAPPCNILYIFNGYSWNKVQGIISFGLDIRLI